MPGFELRPLTADDRTAAETFAARIPHGVIALGFEREAVLRDHVIDGDGRPGDLCILSRFVER